MATTLPDLHSQLTLRDVEGRVWPSRVEAIDPAAITVARPFDLPLEDSPAVGASVEVSWTADGGAYSVPTRLVETVREGLVAMWVVTPNGDTTRAQRRAHFRLILDGDVLFALVESEEGHEPFNAHLVDVSEAGMRVRVSPAEAEPFLVGAEVTGAFSIRQDRFELTGTVLRTLPSERSNHDAAVDVIVLLKLTPTQERELRRSLLAEQVQRRRLARD